MKNSKIPDAEPINENAYVTWNDSDLADKRTALELASKSLDEFNGVERTSASRWGRPADWSNLTPEGTSGRPGLTRADYEAFRPDEAVPKKLKGILRNSDLIYSRVGLVKNVIDLMGDFASQGVRISHPNKRIERFYRNWFAKIHGPDRSERFLNTLYRLGNMLL